MLVAFRVDSSTVIGSGHLMRCLTLAHELERRGATVHFFTRSGIGSLNDCVLEAGHSIHKLRLFADDNRAMDHTCWKSKEVEDDVCETVRILRATGSFDWLVIDNYGMDARWERPLRSCVPRIAVIDDLANREHVADVLLDQNIFRNTADRYKGYLPRDCITLFGPQYALLRQEFHELRKHRLRERAGSRALRFFAFFGGGDATDETGKFLSGWREMAEFNWSVDVVVGGSNPRFGVIKRLASTLSGVHIHRQIDNIAEVMAGANYAFGAAGSSCWERFCLGLEASVVCVAENQAETVETLADLGLIHYIGRAADTNAAVYARCLARVKSLPRSTMKPSPNLMAYVDGYGAQRVADTLFDITRK